MNSKTRNTFLAVLGLIAVLGVALIVLLTRPSVPEAPISGVLGNPKNISFTVGGEKQTIQGIPVGVDVAANARYESGNPKAPISVVEFADYQCPACGLFFNQVESQFQSEFVSSGKMRYIFRDFPLSMHQNAPRAALTAACAANQGKWQEMHNILYRSQDAWSNSSSVDGLFLDYAKQLGLDESALSTCLGSGKLEAQIAADQKLGRDVQLTATPSFVVNGYLFTGIIPIEGWRAIDAEFRSK